MTEQVALPTGGEEAIAVPGDGPLTLREAAASLRETREETAKEAEKHDPATGRYTSQKESAPESASADAAPPEEAPGATTEDDPPAQPDPIDPPRSWTKEDKELFATLPLETQERIAETEKKRERDLRTRQNQSAELQKRQAAELQAAHRARQQYEQALPHLAQAYQAALSQDFADIRTPQDVDRLAIENPSRWVAYQNVRQKNADAQAQMMRLHAARNAEANANWQKWSADQDAKVLEAIPDLADGEKRAALFSKAETYLNDAGFTNDELKQHLSGQRSVSMRDSRIQSLVWKALKYDEAQAQLKKAQQQPKPAPKVQRPGSPRTAQDTARAQIQNLDKQIDNTRGVNQVRLLAKQLQARRQAGLS